MELLASQLLNGLAYGMLLFLLSAGLSLIFGLMNVVSLAHGSLFMLGAVIGFSVVQATGSFWLALALAPIPVIIIGALIEIVFLRRLYARGHLDQVLLTFGFTFVATDLVRSIWGADIKRLPVPDLLGGMVQMGGIVFPVYRLFVIGFGLLLAFALWLFLERTRIGTMVRAGVDDSAMATGLGINVSLLFTGIFALGAGLAALGGVAAGPVIGIYIGMDADIMIPAFIVIVVGGMGSLRGAFIGSVLIGVIDTVGKAYYPDAALFLVYLVMVIVLLARPQGLFGFARAAT
jgi:branched-subunit amino acid ABC-type transport system permease component